jgi:hypothetical protein
MTKSFDEKIRAIRLTAFETSIAERRIICLSQAYFDDVFPLAFMAFESAPQLKIARNAGEQAEEFASKHDYRYCFNPDTLEHYFYPNAS